MHCNSLFTGYTRFLLAWLIFWCAVPATVCTAEDYLSILEAEADNTGSAADVTVEEVHLERQGKIDVGSGKLINPGLSFAEFETVLGSHYPGSHLLYVRLSKRDRERVYRKYQDDNRISAVREEIVRLLSAG